CRCLSIASQLAEEEMHRADAERKDDERVADDDARELEHREKRDVRELGERDVAHERPLVVLREVVSAVLHDLDHRRHAGGKPVPRDEAEEEPMEEEGVKRPRHEEERATSLEEVGEASGLPHAPES